MSNTVTGRIVELLEQGKTRNEIVRLGYKRATVSIVEWKWRNGKLKAPPDKETVVVSANEPSNALLTSIAEDIERDPEVLALRKAIRLAELEKELGRVKMLPEVASMLAVALDHGAKKRSNCTYEKHGVCGFHSWPSRDKIPQAAGDPVQAESPKQHWHVKPTVLFCALYPMSPELDELTDRVLDIGIQVYGDPLSGIRDEFQCECGATDQIAVSVMCTQCGRQTWWGRHQKED